MPDTITRRELLAARMSVRQIASAVHRGALIRVRRGHYAWPGTDADAVRAVRVGGRLACISELRRRGVWVLGDDRLHVQLPPNASRLRNPDDRFLAAGPDDCVRHWRDSIVPGSSSHVSVVDALVGAAVCLERRAFAAAVDSALHLRLIGQRDLPAIRAGIGPHLRRLIDESDHRAESGLESIVRVLARDLGLRVRSQARFRGTGRGDLLVEEWIVIETDGDAFHDEKVTTRDRVRDAAFVRQGRTVLHFRYAQVVYDLSLVAETIIAAVLSHRRVRNSGKIAARARSRARTLGLS